MEYASFAIENLKAMDEEGARVIEGFGSIFNNVDSHSDIVVAGAFAKSIKKRKPAMLWQHKNDMPIGVWETVKETPEGLYLKGRILDTQAGNDAYVLAKEGAISGLSIGFSTKQYEIDSKAGVRKIKEVELYEVSLVTFPSNEKATITNVKSLEGITVENILQHKRNIEAAMRDAGASDSVARYVAAQVKSTAQCDAEVGGLTEGQIDELSKSLLNILNSK